MEDIERALKEPQCKVSSKARLFSMGIFTNLQSPDSSNALQIVPEHGQWRVIFPLPFQSKYNIKNRRPIVTVLQIYFMNTNTRALNKILVNRFQNHPWLLKCTLLVGRKVRKISNYEVRNSVLLPVVYLSWESGLSSESHTLLLCLSTEFCY